jgi:hypothetical protein
MNNEQSLAHTKWECKYLDNVRLENYKGMWQKYQNEDTNHSPNNDQ